MRRIHDYYWIAWRICNTSWIKLVSNLINIWIAVDLDQQLEISSLIAFVTAHILDD